MEDMHNLSDEDPSEISDEAIHNWVMYGSHNEPNEDVEREKARHARKNRKPKRILDRLFIPIITLTTAAALILGYYTITSVRKTELEKQKTELANQLRLDNLFSQSQTQITGTVLEERIAMEPVTEQTKDLLKHSFTVPYDIKVSSEGQIYWISILDGAEERGNRHYLEWKIKPGSTVRFPRGNMQEIKPSQTSEKRRPEDFGYRYLPQETDFDLEPRSYISLYGKKYADRIKVLD